MPKCKVFACRTIAINVVITQRSIITNISGASGHVKATQFRVRICTVSHLSNESLICKN